MNYRINIWPILVLFLFVNSLALPEVLNKETIFRLEPLGPEIIKLKPGIYVDTDFPKGDYVRSMLAVIINKSNISDGDIIPSGTELFNESGEKIGVTINKFEALLPEKFAKEKLKVFVEGYIAKEVIDPASISENFFNKLLPNTHFPMGINDVNNELVKLHFKEWINYDSFRSEIKFNSELIGSPSIRVVVVILANEIFAIIHPGTINKISQFKVVKKGDYYIQYFNNNKDLQKRFEQGFYKQFELAG
jgi:hypothetical protein